MEGIETEEQYVFLKDIGCTYAQGYLFSRPLPAEEIVSEGDERNVQKQDSASS